MDMLDIVVVLELLSLALEVAALPQPPVPLLHVLLGRPVLPWLPVAIYRGGLLPIQNFRSKTINTVVDTAMSLDTKT